MRPVVKASLCAFLLLLVPPSDGVSKIFSTKRVTFITLAYKMLHDCLVGPAWRAKISSEMNSRTRHNQQGSQKQIYKSRRLVKYQTLKFHHFSYKAPDSAAGMTARATKDKQNLCSCR